MESWRLEGLCSMQTQMQARRRCRCRCGLAAEKSMPRGEGLPLLFTSDASPSVLQGAHNNAGATEVN